MIVIVRRATFFADVGRGNKSTSCIAVADAGRV
jgi:hypothetical protein